MRLELNRQSSQPNAFAQWLRSFWAGAILISILGSCGNPLAAVQTIKVRPNIIFLLADDLRWDAVGFAGNSEVKTPHLDQLASKGTVFRNAFVTTAICAVSRASIFAGQHARRTGIHDFQTAFSADAWAKTYPALLKKNGYHLGFIGKFGVSTSAPTNTFDYWDGFNGQGRYFAAGEETHLTRKMGLSAIRYLDSVKEAPFCLSISFKAPHAQDGAQREFPPDPVDEQLYEQLEPARAPTVSQQAFEKLQPFLQQSEGRTRWHRRFATEEMRSRTIRDYYRLITGMDREIGGILAKLAELNLDRNTIIVFTSDNGFYFGEHGLADKWFMHEESIRVPLLIYDPRLPTARAIPEQVLNIDLAPTLLEFAGVTPPASMQGRSLRPFLTSGKAKHWREDWFYEHKFSYGGKIPDCEGVRTERWKYVRYTGVTPPVEELYDLKNDRYEQTNLAGDKKFAKQLTYLQERWRKLSQEAQ